MKFKKLTKILGHQLYVEADCPKIDEIRIALQKKNDSEFDEIFKNMFKK